MKVESESEVAQPCPTPSDRMDYSLPGSSIHGIFQARVLEWGLSGIQSDKSVFPVTIITVILTGNAEGTNMDEQGSKS